MYMNQKNNKPKRSFVPQSIGDTVKKINKNFTSKFGKLEFIIHSNWPKIVGSYFTDYSQPNQITRVRDYENDFGETVYKGYLNVSVAPAAALEFQHFKDIIIEKINSYFGYKAVMDLRITQNYIPNINVNQDIKANHIIKGIDHKNSVKKEVKNMKNKDLKNSLIDLGINITKGSNTDEI